MKRCIKCNTHFEQSGWQCPACCWTPAMMHGYPAFAPELAVDGNGFAADLYQKSHVLIRPDQVVAWRGDDASPSDVLDRVTGRAAS